jgi:hypothetical protein
VRQVRARRSKRVGLYVLAAFRSQSLTLNLVARLLMRFSTDYATSDMNKVEITSSNGVMLGETQHVYTSW